MYGRATPTRISEPHPVTFRLHRLVLAALVLSCCASVTSRAKALAGRQDQGSINVLVILMDDLGWRDLGCYGGRFIETPAADRLAGQGMRFTDAYAAAPVCSPTRASLVTGQYPGRIGMYEVIQLRDRPYAKLTSPPLERELPQSLETIAEILSRRGYVCGSVGKWHVGRTPAEEGFVTVPDRLDDPELTALTARSPQKQIGKITAQALRFLREYRDQPFLLFVNHHAVHAPLEARTELIEKYQAKAARAGVSDIHPTYAAMTEMGDESLSRVLAELNRLDLADKTVVIFTSDNGGLIEDRHLKPPTPLATSNLPLRSHKGDLYEGGIRIPLIIRWPGKAAPQSVCRVPVTSCDLFATILDLAGAAAPGHQSVDGVSLVPLLCGTGGTERDCLFWHFPTSMWSRWPGGAIRKGNFKLIEFYEDSRIELYDLANDLGETNNLAAQRPDLARGLRDELHRWRQSVGARMPTPNPAFDPARADLLPDPPMIPANPGRKRQPSVRVSPFLRAYCVRVTMRFGTLLSPCGTQIVPKKPPRRRISRPG
jgi:arylsulfatase A